MGLFDDVLNPSATNATSPSTPAAPTRAGLFDDVLYPEAAQPKEQPGFWDNMWDLGVKGAQSALTAAKLSGDVATGEMDANAPQLINEELARSRLPKPKELSEVEQSFQPVGAEFEAAGSWSNNPTGNLSAVGSMLWNVGEQAITNPKGVAYLTASQIANMAPSIAGMMAGSRVGAAGGAAVGVAFPPAAPVTTAGGAVAGSLIGAFSGEWPMEAGSELIGQVGKELQRRGLEPTEQNIAGVLGDKAFMSDAVSAVRAKATTTSAVDAAFTRLAGGFISAPERNAYKAAQEALGAGADATAVAAKAKDILKAMPLSTKVARGAGAVGIDVAGGGLSEAAGQYAGYDKVDLADVGMEMLGELGGSAIEIPAAARSAMAGSPRRSPEQNAREIMDSGSTDEAIAKAAAAVDAAAPEAIDTIDQGLEQLTPRMPTPTNALGTTIEDQQAAATTAPLITPEEIKNPFVLREEARQRVQDGTASPADMELADTSDATLGITTPELWTPTELARPQVSQDGVAATVSSPDVAAPPLQLSAPTASAQNNVLSVDTTGIAAPQTVEQAASGQTARDNPIESPAVTTVQSKVSVRVSTNAQGVPVITPTEYGAAQVEAIRAEFKAAGLPLTPKADGTLIMPKRVDVTQAQQVADAVNVKFAPARVETPAAPTASATPEVAATPEPPVIAMDTPEKQSSPPAENKAAVESIQPFVIDFGLLGKVPYVASDTPKIPAGHTLLSSQVIPAKTAIAKRFREGNTLPAKVYAWRVSAVQNEQGEVYSFVEAMGDNHGRSPNGEVIAYFDKVDGSTADALPTIAPAIAKASMKAYQDAVAAQKQGDVFTPQTTPQNPPAAAGASVPKNAPIKQKRKAPKANTLLTTLRDMGGLSLGSKNDVVGDKFAPGGYNQIFRKDARSTIEGLVGKGELDDYLPYELRFSTNDRPDGEVADMQEAAEWLKDKIRSGEKVIPYEAQLELDQKEINAQYESEQLAEEYSEDELNEKINAELQVIAHQEAEARGDARIFNTEDATGIADLSTGTEARDGSRRAEPDFLSSYSNQDILNQEAAQTAAQKAQAAAAKQEQEARVRAEIKQRSEGAAQDFQLGQSADDNLSGQGDIFGAESSSNQAGSVIKQKTLDGTSEAASANGEKLDVQPSSRGFSNIPQQPEQSNPVVRDASFAERVANEKAKPVNDLHDNLTGWKRVEGANNDSVTLVSYDGKKAVRFVSANKRSGAASVQMNAEAHAYAIDNPYQGEPLPTGELVSKPLIEQSKQSAITTIKESDLSPAEKLQTIAAVNTGSLSPEDVHAVVGSTTSATTSAGEAKLEDFGQKLGGARKDMERALAQEFSDDDLAALPLSKIWPADLAEKIEDKFVAAFAFSARQEIPSKPRKGYKVKAWVGKVKLLRELTSMMMSSAEKHAKAENLLKETKGLEGFNAKIELLQAIGREQWKRIGSVREYPNAYMYDQDGNKVAKPSVQVEIDGKRVSFDGAKAVSDVIGQVNGALGVEAKGKRMEFEVRGREGAYFINKKGDPLYRKLKTFETSKEALAYRNSNYDDLVAAWESVKDSDNVKETDVRNSENRARTAQDWRNGKDVTPEQFTQELGFRGVEFGNWVAQGKNGKERQGMLNQAYDALMDLADIIGVPPKALSLNGTLGLGFGSRGSGWASAHFEPDTLVINLTKTRGAGALAHEWFHALDNYFQLQRGKLTSWKREDGYITYQPENYYVHNRTGQKLPLRAFESMMSGERDPVYGKLYESARDKSQWTLKEGVRPEVGVAFSDLVQALNDSPMAKRASLIDKGQAGGYWSRIIERGARSFENYIIHKMMLKGYQNDYLANVKAIEEFSRDEGRYPYLLEEEVAPVAEAFDNLFATLKTRETDQGTALFSRNSTGTGGGMNIRDLKAVATRIKNAYKNLPNVVVLESPNALDLTDAAQQRLYDYIARNNALEDVEGATHEGEIYLFASGLQDEFRAEFVLAQHEITHYGLRAVYGAGADAVLQAIWMSNQSVRVDAKLVKIARGIQSNIEATEEVLADIPTAELVKLKGWRRMVQLVRNWLQNHGFTSMAKRLDTLLKSGLNEQQKADLLVADVVSAARDWVKSGKTGQLGTVSDTRLSATLNGDFERWFSDSKVVDADGKPLVVYHGSPFGPIERFDSSEIANESGAFFFTESKEVADNFASGKYLDWEDDATPRPYVMESYLSLKKPAVFDGNVEDELTIDQFFERMGLSASDVPKDLSDLQGQIENAAWVWYTNYASVFEQLRKLGFDGFIATEKGARVYAAFDPTQIKSATGNNGEFSGTRLSVRENARHTASTKPTWIVPEPTKLDDLIYKSQNKLIDLKRIIDAIKSAGGKVLQKYDPYLQEELYQGRASAATDDFVDNELSPLLREMKLRNVSQEKLNTYLQARHAREANALIAQREPGLSDGGSGMTNQAADDFLSGLGQVERNQLERVAAMADAIIAKTRKMTVGYNLVSQQQMSRWESMFRHYVPLNREDYDGNSMGTGQGFSIKGIEARHRTGSTGAVVDILANIAQQREKTITRGEKNRVSVALMGLAALNPNADFWEFGPVHERRYNEATGQVEVRVNANWKQNDNVVVAKVLDADGNIVERGLVFNETNPRGARIAAALKNLDGIHMNLLLGASAKVTRFFASVNTQWNPVFGLFNLMRDAQGMALNLSSTPLAGKQADVMGQVIPAIKGIYQDIRAEREGHPGRSEWAHLWEQMKHAGGMTGYRALYQSVGDRADKIARELDPYRWHNNMWGKIFTANGTLKVPMKLAQQKAGWLFDWLSDYNETLEGATRLATFKVALENGLSEQEAASLAKNITVNFNRKGQVGQQAGALYAFFNAAMQGTARIAETVFAIEGGDIRTARLSKAGKVIVYGGVMLGVMQALLLAAAGFDEDDDPKDFVRERSLIIPLGWITGERNYIAIPMPLGYHVLPNIGRVATEWALSGGKDTPKRVIGLVGTIVDAFNPIGSAGVSMQTIAPTPLDPLAALAENRDWTGRKIAMEKFNPNDPTPGFQRSRDTATYLSKLLAEGINALSGGDKYVAGVFSPTADQIDYLAGQVGGGVWRETSKAEQFVTSRFTGETLPTYKVPLVGRLYGSAEGQSSQAGRYYETMARVAEVKAGLEGRLEDRLPVAEFKADNPEWRLIGQARLADSTIKKLKKAKALFKEKGDTSKVAEIEDRITREMRRLNDAADRLEQIP